MSAHTIGEPHRRNQERRGAARYEISSHVLLEWRETDGSVHKISGSTREISARGVCIVAYRIPPLWTTVDLIVTLPRLVVSSGKGVQMRGKGTVVRVADPSRFIVEVSFRIVRA
jgi:hypothetical protein